MTKLRVMGDRKGDGEACAVQQIARAATGGFRLLMPMRRWRGPPHLLLWRTVTDSRGALVHSSGVWVSPGFVSSRRSLAFTYPVCLFLLSRAEERGMHRHGAGLSKLQIPNWCTVFSFQDQQTATAVLLASLGFALHIC